MSLLAKSRSALQEGGGMLLILRGSRFLYKRFFRELMPYRKGDFNEVTVPAYRLFEPTLGFYSHSRNRQDYEKGVIDAIKENVEEEDDVVVLGGGYGVSSVWAARMNSCPEKVCSYEGSKEQCKVMKKTFSYEGFEEIKVNHAIVGSLEGDLFGKLGNPRKIEPSEIPQADVLVADVEGSERGIIKSMSAEPDTIIVETHGVFGSPTDEVKDILEERGYYISSIREAETEEKIQDKDVKVITATKDSLESEEV